MDQAPATTHTIAPATGTPPALAAGNPSVSAPLVEEVSNAPSTQTTPASLPRRAFRWCASTLDWLFGFLALIFGLAALSVIPVLNFFSLGYLLEASGRVAESKGKLRTGFVGVRKAAVLGRIVIGAWLFILPVRFVASLWRDAELIAPGSATANGWRFGLVVLTILAVAHIVWACIRGGKLRHFLWPAPLKFCRWIGRPGSYETMRDTTLDYLAGLRLPHYFWLGARGFVGAVVWLALPVLILIGASKISHDIAALVALLGAGLLAIVVLYLPFLQTHFARENRFAALFEIKAVRQMFRRAPIAFWVALLITLLFALPLYLLKIQLTPREVAWLPSLLFVIFIFPARLLTGWAVGRAERREAPRHWAFLWLSRLGGLPIVAAYALVVFLTQYLSWHGSLSMLEQHAFLVPAPLMGL
jgi:hypothetical protein